jgi:putative photosynthetic complex assembly protein
MADAAAIPFPRAPLYGAMVALAVIVAAVAYARLNHLPLSPPDDLGPPVQSRMVSFADMAGGGVEVKDATTGEIIAVIKPGTNGFLRGALRGAGRARRQEGGNMTDPFRLERWKNGHITLADPVNDAKIDFAAFGPTNAKVFESFLPPMPGASQ